MLLVLNLSSPPFLVLCPSQKFYFSPDFTHIIYKDILLTSILSCLSCVYLSRSWCLPCPVPHLYIFLSPRLSATTTTVKFRICQAKKIIATAAWVNRTYFIALHPSSSTSSSPLVEAGMPARTRSKSPGLIYIFKIPDRFHFFRLSTQKALRGDRFASHHTLPTCWL